MGGKRTRFVEVLEILSRHGLGTALGLVRPGRASSAAGGGAAHLSHAERVRAALEELGPTFIKLGQIASTRADLLPPEYVRELATLQDAAPPVPIAAVLAVIRDELGMDASEAFSRFDDLPLASASIGQAHAAEVDGVEVVVKVRRPGVVESVLLDLEVLRELAAVASRASALAREHDVAGLVEEFSATLRAELDYVQEARNAERFAEQLAGAPDVHVPRVLWDRTTSRVLTLERVRGLKVNDVAALDAAGIDRRLLAVRCAQIVCSMVFEAGFFHADPHPGNLFVEEDGSIGLIDFGMVGEIDDALRERLVRVVVAVARRDGERAARALVELCGRDRPVDENALRRSVARLIRRYAGRPLAEIPPAGVITEIIEILRSQRIHLPQELALLLKVLVMIDGLGRQLDPEFDLFAVLTPFARDLLARDLGPLAAARRLRDLMGDMVQLGVDAPEHLRRALALLEQGRVDVHVQVAELQPLVVRVERIGNRLVVGTVAAALIGSIGRVIASDPVRYRSWEEPLVRTGFAGLGALGAYVVASGVRRRNRWPRR